ncbi:HEPN domain-containing protein [Alteromonas sp. ASW11-19]|uniref:HEPN domain-containing protein n=1 Tax=Alteromonas salexigens TaxID=2982530 RepID=A0ABT2VNI6_9ALTE|nr:HEPN domain-containing protein [Alteromonas salexigens]MCU7554664.1 HEPN domain-containing protein [Alteromonas salexigens]
MPYKKSFSRKEFDSAARGLTRSAKYVSLKKNKVPNEVAQCVYRNLVFQTSAALEQYVKTVLDDWVYLLKINDKKAFNLPENLISLIRIKKLTPTFQGYISRAKGEKETIKNLSEINALNECFLDHADVNSIMDVGNLIDDKKYPSKSNLIDLFYRFGILNIFDECGRKGKRDFKSILNSFSDVRTQISHEHPIPDLTHSDVKKHSENISRFVHSIDKVLYSKVVSVSGEECWKTDLM